MEPTGDLDLDGDVDAADYAAMAACLSGPDAPAGFVPGCTSLDLDLDLDVDLRDFAAFQIAFTGTRNP